MSNTVISVENLSKSYRLGSIGTGTFYDDLRQWWGIRRGQSDPYLQEDQHQRGKLVEETIWALNDLNFNVKLGETVGFIGANGAGKSTLLKILSQITAPTSGVVKLKGRVASLLEVGTGFHPELTGRENIYLNGAILGMKRAEVEKKLEEILDFAGVDKFIDTPVKRYSSGMRVRLGFAVAAHLESEIMIVDEVLAVGDASFRRKSLGKMGDVVTMGRTVLFVSHNMAAMQNLCDRVIWLDNGRMVEDGPTAQVIPNYLRATTESNLVERTWNDIHDAPGNDKVKIKSLFIRPCNGDKSRIPAIDEEVEVGVEFWSLQPGQSLGIGLQFVTTEAVMAFSTSTNHHRNLQSQPLEKGLYFASCRIYANLLNSNQYRIRLRVVEDESTVIFKMDDALAFELLDSTARRGGFLGRRQGTVAPLLEWNLDLKSNL